MNLLGLLHSTKTYRCQDVLFTPSDRCRDFLSFFVLDRGGWQNEPIWGGSANERDWVWLRAVEGEAVNKIVWAADERRQESRVGLAA